MCVDMKFLIFVMSKSMIAAFAILDIMISYFSRYFTGHCWVHLLGQVLVETSKNYRLEFCLLA